MSVNDSIESYRGVAPATTLDALSAHVEKLKGARVLHINATPYGGGVAELLRSMVPLLNDLGLVADWKIISGDTTFFSVTKAIHNALQGAEQGLSPDDEAAYRTNAAENAKLLEEDYDFVFVHDPQPVSLLPLHGKGNARWIWRCHIDTSKPNEQVWSLVRESLADYDAAVFTLPDFVPPDLPVARRAIIPPAIDPLSPKNLPLAAPTARQVLEWIGVRLDRPLVTQVSRFDPWKDPLGVIAAYRLVREHFLLPRLVLNEVQLMNDLVAARPVARSPSWLEERDPVCGMALTHDANAITATHGRQVYRFCSAACRVRFLDAPSRFGVP
jgi:trehalose synthase